ncbi:hypothetical protein GCM10009827_106850 [Dactylosporangium maewongense]|uniref:Uncharacterized protein n=1 Tax=Dactylosporangium maewongense TaxID=634393 RepID=A0ABP4NZZ0_9ACTN
MTLGVRASIDPLVEHIGSGLAGQAEPVEQRQPVDARAAGIERRTRCGPGAADHPIIHLGCGASPGLRVAILAFFAVVGTFHTMLE